jgi:acyl dehydratase
LDGISRPTKYPELTTEAVEEARGLIGVPLRRRPHYTVATRDVLLRYAKALGCRNPLYTDPDHGVFHTHWASLLAHPTVIFVFDHTVVAPKLSGIHTIYAGVTIEWKRQIRAGDTVHADAKLTGVEPKHGSFGGDMVLQTGEVRYENQRSELVAIAQPRILRIPRDAARARAKYSGLKRHHYDTAEFERIMAAYEKEQIRGASRPLYIEDVAAGMQLPEVVKGPLTTEDMNFFVGEVAETLFFREFLAHMRRHPADVYWHEDKHMPDSWDSSLLLDKVAQEFGFPIAHDTGLQRVAWLECLITNWMGDLAMLRKVDVRLTRPFLHADTAWLKGEVARTEVVDRRALVHLTLTCENQRREVVATGTAVVELPSRDFDVLQPGLVVGS